MENGAFSQIYFNFKIGYATIVLCYQISKMNNSLPDHFVVGHFIKPNHQLSERYYISGG